MSLCKECLKDREYNGWTNYETWLVSLWIGNEQGIYESMIEMALEVNTEAEAGEYEWQTRPQQALYSLEDRLKDTVEELFDFPTEGFAADLIGGALSEVDWRSIAEHTLEEHTAWPEAEAEDVEA